MPAAELPPVDGLARGGHVLQDARRALHAGAATGEPAELPQLARSALVLVQNLVDVEDAHLASAEAHDGPGDALDELTQARLVVGGDQRPIGLPLTLRCHPGIVPPR